MNGQTFLQKALEKSFLKPIMTDYNNIDFIFCRDSSGCFVMGDKSDCQFAPCLISRADIKNLINASWYDVRHSLELNKEYETFRHYFEENIIIPENSSTIQSLRLWLDLTSVSRQAAQKKRVIAALMPPTFKETIITMEKEYRAALKKIQLCEQENLDAVEIAQITDFVTSYKKIRRKSHLLDLVFFANKFKMRRYLLSALKIIRQTGTVPPEFELSHTFLGNLTKWGQKYADSYRNDMFELIGKLKIFAQNSSLLDLAEIFLASPQKYKTAFKEFCNQRRAPNLDDILAIKKAAQTMFNEFAKLCYLEGVRKAFEINFLDECPAAQNPQLPSVSPNEEIGKIRNIVESCHQLDCQKTLTGRSYNEALKRYHDSQEQINQILINYIGISTPNFEKDIA